MNKTLRAMILLLGILSAGVAADEHVIEEHFDAWILQTFRPEALATVQGIRALDVLMSENVHEYPSPHATHALEMREFIFHGLTILAVVERARPAQVRVTTVRITSPPGHWTTGSPSVSLLLNLSACRCHHNRVP